MHGMIPDILRPDRLESSRADMQGNKNMAHSPLPESFKNGGGKMQTRRGSGGRALPGGIDSLVKLRILKLPLDVRGKRHPAQAGDLFFRRAAGAKKTDQPFSPPPVLLHHRLQAPGKDHPGPGFQAAAGLNHGLPEAFPLPVQQQQLRGKAASGAAAQETGRNHAGIVRYSRSPAPGTPAAGKSGCVPAARSGAPAPSSWSDPAAAGAPGQSCPLAVHSRSHLRVDSSVCVRHQFRLLEKRRAVKYQG